MLKRIPIAVCVSAGCVFAGLVLNSNAQDIWFATAKLKPEGIFLRNIENRFLEVPFKKVYNFNFDRAVSVTAIPLAKNPIGDMKELEARPVTIGVLYLPSGSARFKLDPGVYRIEVGKEGAMWKARFLDDKGKQKGVTDAKVSPAEAVPFPIASVEQSVCYRFDKTIVCI